MLQRPVSPGKNILRILLHHREDTIAGSIPPSFCVKSHYQFCTTSVFELPRAAFICGPNLHGRKKADTLIQTSSRPIDFQYSNSAPVRMQNWPHDRPPLYGFIAYRFPCTLLFALHRYSSRPHRSAGCMYTLWGYSQHACALAKVFVIVRPCLQPFCVFTSQACLAGCPFL